MPAGCLNARMRRVTDPWRAPRARGRRVASLGCAGGAALLALVSRAGHAAADSDHAPDVVQGTSACPEPRAVWAALGALVVIDGVEPRLRALPGGPPPVEVTDRGAAFRVRVGDRTRDYEDTARDCGNRAKLAALFVALAADSAEDPLPAKPPEAPPAPPPPVNVTASQPPAARPVGRHTLSLEVGADARVAIGASSTAPGALVQLAFERGRWELTAGARGGAPAEATIGEVHVRQWRVAAQLAARVRLGDDRPVFPFLELGAVAALLSERATDLATARAGEAGELGIVGGGGVRFLRRGWGSAFVLVEAELDPAPPTISALPAGEVGRTPRLWAGAAAGVSVGLF